MSWVGWTNPEARKNKKNIGPNIQPYYYRLVKGFKINGLFTGQYNTEDYGTYSLFHWQWTTDDNDTEDA